METVGCPKVSISFIGVKKPIAHHLVAARVFLIGQVTSSDMKVPLTKMTETEMASKQNSLV